MMLITVVPEYVQGTQKVGKWASALRLALKKTDAKDLQLHMTDQQMLLVNFCLCPLHTPSVCHN